MIRKQQPMMGDAPTAVSTAPARVLVDEIDADLAALADKIAQMNHLMSQSRSGNVAPEATFMLQEATERMRSKVVSLQGDAAMIRTAHAPVLQMNPMVPMTGNDPMAASMGQQPPMNMPPGMSPQEGM